VPSRAPEQCDTSVTKTSQSRDRAAPPRRHHRRVWTAVLGSCSLALSSRLALAAPHDDAAAELIKQAMYEDYVETNFVDSGKKLAEALALCQGEADCSASVRARILCELGIVEFAQQRQDEGRAHFAREVKEDPKVSLEQDFSTPELRRELAAVKSQFATAPPAETAPPEVATPVPTKRIPGSSDCPPDFPGCTPPVATCTSDDECSHGEKCSDGTCRVSDQADDAATKPYRKNWLSLAIQEDLLLLPEAHNACGGGTGYACFSASSGTYYTASPFANADDLVNSGLKPATTRILAGFDRAIGQNFLLGARLGYVLGGGPTRPGASSFLPVHAEARISYWFGTNPLARAGFRFYAVLGAGLAEVDASQSIDVYANAQDAKVRQNSLGETAWRKTGNGFAALGVGGMFAIGPNMGIVLEVKAMEMFPTTGTAIAPELGYAAGF